MIDLEKLKALAESIPVDSNIWHLSEEHESSQYQGYMVLDNWGCHVASTSLSNADGITAEFIAAANPAAVLELISEIQRMRKDVSRLDWIEENYSGFGGGNFFELRLHLSSDMEGGLRDAIDAEMLLDPTSDQA